MVTTRSSQSDLRSPYRKYSQAARPNVFYRAVRNYIESDCQLSPEELRRLASHKYSAIDTSWLDELCMKNFWERVVVLYPEWLAPNLITLIGLIINLITVCVLSMYCPTARETAPSWVYLLAAVGIFVYQTLDATDGKQARRIGCASPLGEMFDHGCDSASQVFITLNVCYALRLGDFSYLGVFPVCVVSIAIFYCAHWSTYCTGQLRFAKFDVTEAQMVIIIMLLITAILGPGVWSIGVGTFQLRTILLLGCFVALMNQFVQYFSVIMNDGCGKNGSTVADTSVVFPGCPLLAVIIPFCMIYSKAESDVYRDHITVFVVFFGAVAAKATNRVIVAHMSRSALVLWDWIYLGPLIVILNQYYNVLIPELPLLYFATFYAYFSLFFYCVNITQQLCSHLNIYCFKVTPKRT